MMMMMMTKTTVAATAALEDAAVGASSWSRKSRKRKSRCVCVALLLLLVSFVIWFFSFAIGGFWVRSTNSTTARGRKWLHGWVERRFCRHRCSIVIDTKANTSAFLDVQTALDYKWQDIALSGHSFSVIAGSIYIKHTLNYLVDNQPAIPTYITISKVFIFFFYYYFISFLIPQQLYHSIFNKNFQIQNDLQFFFRTVATLVLAVFKAVPFGLVTFTTLRRKP